MRTYKKFQLLILSVLLLTISSCVESDDFNTPESRDIPFLVQSGDEVISIAAVIAAYNQNGEILDYGELNEQNPEFNRYIEGYVVSSDEGGNFFEEIVIQDNAENPSAGIVVQVDVNPLFTFYEFGRKVFINLDGLSVNEENGVIQIGVRSGDELEKIPGNQRNTHIIRDAEVATIVPLEVSIGDFSDNLESLFIRLNDMQFIKSEVIRDNNLPPLTLAGEAGDQFDGERTLENCGDNQTVILSTSTFSDFKSLSLPLNRGSIDGILTRDFFDSFYTLVINSPEDINFENSERCDPIVLSCNNPINGPSTTTIFSEDFETFGTFASEGWTNMNISGGNTQWVEGGFGGNSYAQISGFNAGASEINVWLITPTINLDSSTEEELNFDVQTNFNNGDVLTVWVSSDFTGDPTTATWERLDTNIPTGNPSGFGSFEAATTVNLSCLSGDIHIGFFYQGSDPNATTRYHVDNVEVSGK